MKENAPTEHKNNWPGTRIGHLTVMDATDQRKGGYTVWRCRCDCGNEILLDTRALQRQAITDCGCYNAEKCKESQKNVDGTRISLLETVLSGKLRATNTSGHTGVSFHKRTGKWRASITFQGKDHYLGEYEEKADAIKARERAEDMFRDFLRGLREEVPERDA